MGGEPLMNPDLHNWIKGIRDMMPETQIRFVTNGLLLAKNRRIVDLLHEVGNAVLKISYHVDDPSVDQEIQHIRERFAWRDINEFGIDRWITGRDFRFQIARPKKFIRTFRGDYTNMQPHDNEPVAAFDLCVQKRCPMLLDGVIYKCGTAALTQSVLERFGWPNREQWQPYLGHGLSADCTDQELERFLANFGRPHAICRQCPTAQDLDSILDHTITVTRK
jgi:sulfatase maturation enzyme AslB (radical SAM superfamily)